MSELVDIKSLSGYLGKFGTVLSRKAISSLHPLHVPGRDAVPSFDYVPEHRTPFEAQAHLISGGIKALDNNSACFMIGEPGCGKTISAILCVHEHASRSRRKGGSGGKYRSIVICPDHLISKWKNEIEDTIPGAVVHCWRPEEEIGSGFTLNKWWDFLNLMSIGEEHTKIIDGDKSEADPKLFTVSEGSRISFNDHDGSVCDEVHTTSDRPVGLKLAGKVLQNQKRWKAPAGPEWIVIGRDQIKRMPEWKGIGQPRRGFDGVTRSNEPHRVVVVDRKPIEDAKGSRVLDSRGRYIEKAITEKQIVCPRCGAVPTKKGVPLSAAALYKTKQHSCKALIMEEVGSDSRKGDGLDRIYQTGEGTGYLVGHRPGIPNCHLKSLPGSLVNHAGKQWRIRECGEPLYQWVRKPNWWPAAQIVQRKLNKLAKYLVVDECHEQKSDTSAQSMAMGKILGATRYCLALTGTFIGGYASHLFPLLIRLAARDMQARSFEWGKPMDFVERYGCIDRIVRSEAPVESSVGKGTRSMRKMGQPSTERKCRPGIMPTLFSEMVMPLAMFLKLDQFIDDLPGFEENMIACELPHDIQNSYDSMAKALANANKELIANGNMKLMGTMLWTLLSYPDHPWGWEPTFPYEGKETEPTMFFNGLPIYKDGQAEHAIGWWREPKVWTRENFNGVVTPDNFEQSVILPKERKLIELCKKHQEAGDQTWVYCEMTQKRDVMPRLQRLMEAEGLRVGVLKSGDVSPREREVWIQKNGYLFDVMISHPQLVATGLDLFSIQHGNHNFNHLVFYQTGYNLFRIRQASRRSWRIGQPKDCTVTYLYYSGTSQASALAVVGRKAQAAQQLEEGSVSDEGLAAMGGDVGAQAALVKALGEHIDPSEIQRNWSRVKSGAKRVRPARSGGDRSGVRRPAASLSVPAAAYVSERIPPPGVRSPLDNLPIQVQIVGESMLKAIDDDSSVDNALSDFRSWLSKQAAPTDKPALKVHEPEQEAPEPAKPKRLEEFGREELSAMFDKMRDGTLKEDDWDW